MIIHSIPLLTNLIFSLFRYIVTFSPLVDQRAEEPQSIIIWDVRSGLKKRAFNAERPPVWPVFKWSSDDKYFARIVEDALSVYETPVSLTLNVLGILFCYCLCEHILITEFFVSFFQNESSAYNIIFLIYSPLVY